MLASSTQVSLVLIVQLNREIGASRGHWGDRRLCGCQSWVGGYCTRELHGAAAVESIAMDGQSRANKNGRLGHDGHEYTESSFLTGS